MEMSTADVLLIEAAIVISAIAVRWLLSKKKDDKYLTRNDYTIRDFYTRKRR